MKKEYYDNELIDNIRYTIKKKEYKQALHKIEEYRILYPNDIFVDVYYARCLSFIGNNDKAIEICKDMLNNKLHDEQFKITVILNLADFFINDKKYDEAIETLNHALKLYNNDFKIILKLCHCYYNSSKYDKALETIELPSKNVNINITNTYKGEIYYKQKRFDDAINILNITNDKNLYVINLQRKYICLGKCYLLKNDYTSSYNALKKALKEKNYYYWEAYSLIGALYIKSNDYKIGLAMCEAAYNEFNIQKSLVQIITVYTDDKNYDKANYYIDKITDPKLKKLMNGKLLLNQGDFTSAEIIFNDLLQEYEGFRTKEINYQLAIIYIRTSKYKKALELINDFNNNNILNRDIERMIVYIYNKLGLDYNNIKNVNYTKYQIENYSEELAIQHIQSSHVLDNSTNRFNSEIDIKELMNKIKPLLTNDKKRIDSLFDKYIIDYENIGIFNNNPLNKLIIYTILDTKDILTMYPTNADEIIHDMDDINVTNKAPVKRLTQIEKFNQRYGKL